MRRNQVRSILLSVLLCVVFSSVVHAKMTIYFRDGSSKQVEKIVFKGQTADLYLGGGLISTVQVNTIDLQGSGIPEAQGTYGGTVGGTTGGPALPKPVAPPADQGALKSQYEEATKTATALHDQGMIHSGDTVRIVASTDLTVTIVYKDASGSYRKASLEAGSFSENFKINEAAKPVATTPAPTVQPIPPLPVPEMPTEIDENQHSTLLDELDKKGSEPLALSSSRSSSILLPSLVSGGVLVAFIAVAFVMMKKREKQFVSPPAELSRRQNLVMRELEAWHSEGKSKTELVERCLRKLHLERPKALSSSLRMLKGDPKTLVVSAIARDTGQNAAQAELSYEKLNQILNMARQMVEESSPVPLEPAAEIKAGSVARAAVPERSFSPTAEFRIVSRPTSITVCAIILLLASLLVAVVALTPAMQAQFVARGVNPASLWIGVVFGLVCAYGYWAMKRWAVVLYGINLALVIFNGMQMTAIALPAFIVGIGIINFHDMTWK